MSIKAIDPKTLHQWLMQNEALLVDVREPAEFAEAHIEQALLVPLATVAKDTIPVLNGKKLVFQCRSGRRSEAACARVLAEDSMMDVYNLEGGIMAWIEEGYVVKQGE